MHLQLNWRSAWSVETTWGGVGVRGKMGSLVTYLDQGLSVGTASNTSQYFLFSASGEGKERTQVD